MCSFWHRLALAACLWGAVLTAGDTNVVDVRIKPSVTTTSTPATLVGAERALEIAKKKCVSYGAQVYSTSAAHLATLHNPDAKVERQPRCQMEGETVFAVGAQAAHGEFPHMVALGSTNPRDNKGDVTWMCGGSLISERFVLTAGYCTFRRSTGPVRWALLGTTTLSDLTAQRIEVAEAIRHPANRPPSHYNDIALLRLATAPALSHELRPACVGIAQAQTVPPGAFGTAYVVTGWGANETDGGIMEHLKKVELYLVAVEKCDEIFGSFNGSRKLKDGIRRESMLCIGNKEAAKDPCQGDGGGPLQTRLSASDTSCMYDVAGVVSFGTSRCAEALTASVFTNVRHFLPWIVSVVWPEEANATPL